MEKWWDDTCGEKRQYLEGSLSQCHFFHKSHRDWPEIEPLQRLAGD
jgi:hypothetical protein